jgi:hypothetical protein
MTLQQIIEQVDNLTLDEQVELKQYLEERTQAQGRLPRVTRRRKWSELAGIAPYPLTGEDAQTWVNRTRAEEDERVLRWESRS